MLETPNGNAHNGAVAAAIPPGPTIPHEHMPENLREHADEINVYMREMPRRRQPANPVAARPTRASVPGSGTGVGV